MGQQFDRDYVLEVSEPGQTGRKWTPPTQVEFTVEQGASRGMDRATITLVNLSDESVRFLTRAGLRVFLRAGYVSDGLGLIFSGQIAKKGVRTSSVTTQDGTRRTTVIEAGVGEITLQETRFDRSYAADVTNLQIIDDIASALGVRLRDRDRVPQLTYAAGWAHSGRAQEALDDLGRDIGSDWTMQGGDLYMLPPDTATGESAVVISKETGLVGRAVLQVNGVEFKSRLNRRMRPKRKVVLDSRDATGTYQLTKVAHNGNWRQGPWETVCFCRKQTQES